MMTEKQYRECSKLLTLGVAAFLALLISVILCLLLESCGSARNMQSRQESMQENAAQQHKDTASASAQANETEAEETTEVSNSHTIVYDNSLPVDSTTGRAPVLSETYTSIGKQTKKNKEKQTSTQQQASATQQTVINKQTETAQMDETTRKEISTPKWIAISIWGLVVLAGIGVAIWTNKRTNWISSLLGFIKKL